MSIHVTSCAIRQSQSSGVARLVLLCLCDKANDAGEAWPSRESMMEWANASESAVKSALRWLRENGEIQTLREGGGRAKSTRYLVSVGLRGTRRGQDKPGKIEPVSAEKGAEKNRLLPERGQILPLKGSESAPDPSVTHQSSSSSAREPEIDDWSDDRLYDEVLAAVGLTDKRVPTHWMPPAAPLHIRRWRTELKLTGPRIAAAARASRANHADPPKGPKALDGVMRRVAAELSAPAMKPTVKAASRGCGQTETREQRLARWDRIGR